MNKKYKKLEQEYEQIQDKFQDIINKVYEVVDEIDETYKIIQENKKEIIKSKNKIQEIENISNLIISIYFPFQILLWSANINNAIIRICSWISFFLLVIFYSYMTKFKNMIQKKIYALEEYNEIIILLNNIKKKRRKTNGRNKNNWTKFA